MNTHCLPLCLALTATFATASELKPEPDPIRLWQPGTPGVTMGSASYDEPSATFMVKSAGQAVVPVLTDTQPQRTLQRYSVVGEVRYEKVGGTGYLELWNVFPPAKPGMSKGHYFSRTRDSSGPMGSLQGDHEWREFILPFDPKGAVGPPLQLEFNVALPEGGTVWLRHLRLAPLPEATTLSRAALVGTVGGTFIGVIALIVALCVKLGRGLALARAAILTVQIAGFLSVIAALVEAWWRDWPVANCLGLLGFIALFNVKTLRRQVSAGIEERERRRMSAMDA